MVPGSERSFREPSKTTTMWLRTAPCLPALTERLVTRVDGREQLGDPRGYRLRVVADQRGAVPAGRRHRQPADPLPARPARRVGEHEIRRSFGLCRVGGLGHEPATDGARRFTRAGDADHAAQRGGGSSRARPAPSRTPACGARPARDRSARPPTAGRRCPPAGPGSRGRYGAAPTAGGADRRRWTRRLPGPGTRRSAPCARRRERRWRPARYALCARGIRHPLRIGPASLLAVGEVVPIIVIGLSPDMASMYTSFIMTAIATPMITGATAIRTGNGRRSPSVGGEGSWNLVTRCGGSSRGGRLKSMPPSSDRCSAASGAS